MYPFGVCVSQRVQRLRHQYRSPVEWQAAALRVGQSRRSQLREFSNQIDRAVVRSTSKKANKCWMVQRGGHLDLRA